MAGRGKGTSHHSGSNASQSINPSLHDGLDHFTCDPVRIYPRNTSSESASVIKQLMTITHPVVVVGFLASRVQSTTGIYIFANRLIGRTAFHEQNRKDSALGVDTPWPATIQLFYDDVRHVVYLVGLSKVESEVVLANANRVMENESMEMDLPTLMEKYQQEQQVMEVLLYTCCNLVFVFTEQNRPSTSIIQHIRLISNEKRALQTLLSTVPTTKTPGNREKTPLSITSSPFAPGKCIPLVLFAVPVEKDLFINTSNTKSAIVTYCKTQETMISSMLRSVRRGIVGNLRTRDALTASNVSKERRLFNIDPSHCVVVISNQDGTDLGHVTNRFDRILTSLPSYEALAQGEYVCNEEDVWNQLKEDEMGMIHAIQSLNRFVDGLFSLSASPYPPRERGGGSEKEKESKDSNPIRMELLSLAQWLKSFKSVVKVLTKKTPEVTVNSTTGGRDVKWNE